MEVADIFRAHGAAWCAANKGHVSLGQLRAMSAIKACRTAALGGHVARCEGCTHTVIGYNSCRNRHCPKCQGSAAREWLAEREAELLCCAVLPHGVHGAGCGRRLGVSEQGGDLRHPVQGVGRDDADDRRRSQASRAPASASRRFCTPGVRR